MLQTLPHCQLPAYISEYECFPFGLMTASVPADSLDDLERHPGVIGVWPQSEERLERVSRDSALSVELQVPAELAESVSSLFPALVRKGAQRVSVFDYRRPGEPPYWLAFIVTSEGRQTVGTPDMRHMSLASQAPDLLRQLRDWEPASGTGGDAWPC